MSDPTFGIGIQRIDNEPRPAIVSDMSIVGLVGVSEDADATEFPLNTPAFLYSDDAARALKLGSGDLADEVEAINDQLGEFQVAAKIVVVRVAEGADDAETIANIVGSSLAKTGVHALLKAGPDLGFIPRLIGVAGRYTAIFNRVSGTTTVTRANKAGGNTGNGTMTLATPAYGGSVQAGVYQVRCKGGGYAATVEAGAGNVGGGTLTMHATPTGDGVAIGTYRATCIVEAGNGGVFLVEDPEGRSCGVATVGELFDGPVRFTIADVGADFQAGDFFEIAVAAAVPADGGVFSVRAPSGAYLADATVGVAYDTAHLKFTIADGSVDFAIGDGFDVTVAITAGTAEANAAVAELPSVLDKLLGVAVVQGPDTNEQDYTDWRETIQTERIIPLASSVRVGSPAVQKGAVGRVLGIAVRRDHEFGGRPFHSWANQPVQGIVGPNRSIPFSLTDGATEGQSLLSKNAGIIIRGEMGVEAAIASGGFVYVGTDTCAEDDLWRFYNVVRGRDYIHLMFLRTLRFYLGRYNITGQAIQAVVNTMNFALRDLKADGDILGYKVGFLRDQNSPEELRLGRFNVAFAAEEAPVLRYLGIQSARYRPALDALLDELLAQVGEITG